MKRVILITGGAQGIGRGIAASYLRKNPEWNVVVVDHDKDGLDDFRSFVDQRFGQCSDRVLLLNGDVGGQAMARQVVAAAVAQFHRIDVLVNNAGGGAFGVKFEEQTEEGWFRVINANLSSCFFCSQAAASELEKSNGSIINVSSTRARMSEPNTEAYSAAKGGVESLTHSLAATLSGKVNVNCVCPGWIDVSGREFGPNREQANTTAEDRAQHFSGRVGCADDIAEAVSFLAENRFISGQCIVVDGGMTKKMIYA